MMSNCSIKYFSQVCTEEIIILPFNNPDIEQVISIVADCDVISLKTINSMKGVSYEGQYLTGKKLAAEIKLRQKILYAAEKSSQAVHIIENEKYLSTYIVIPDLIEGTDPALLIKNKILRCKVDVEDIYFTKIDNRRIFKNLCLLLSAEITPTYELGCSIQKNNGKASSILIMHSDGTHSINLTGSEGQKSWKPVWSPLGREIAYISDLGFSKAVNIYSLKTSSSRQLTRTSVFTAIGSYCWSSEGTKLFIAGSTEDNDGEIYSINTNDTGLKQVSSGNGLYESYMPKCSPGGLMIGFLRAFRGLTDLWIMNYEGLDCVKLTACGSVRYFDWSPDGKSIIYVSSKDGIQDQLYIININNNKNYKINFDSAVTHIKKVQYSPDGLYIVFIGSQFEREDIYTYDLKNRRLVNSSSNNENIRISDLVWSADSDKIYYSATDFCFYNIFVVAIENKIKRQLTNSAAYKLELSYRPKIC